MSNLRSYMWHGVASEWRWARAPSRPSQSEILKIRSVLSKFQEGSKLLIFGSTPELRDLAYLHKFDTTVADFNKSTFFAMRKLMRQPDITKLHICNWLNLNLNKKFDLILGDAALNMISIEDYSRVLKITTSLLLRNGLNIQRVWVRFNNKYSKANTSLNKIVKEHDNKRGDVNYFSSLAIPFVNYFYNQEKKHVDIQELLRNLEKAYHKNVINYRCLNAFLKPWSRYFMPNSLPAKTAMKSILTKYFIIENILHGDDLFKKWCPIFVMKKR